MSREELLIRQLADESPGAFRLARVVSLAVLIEPQLLRRARLELLKGVDAGAEADLWLSRLVHRRGPSGITLLPRAAELLRRDLARKSERFESAWLLVEGMHRGSPPTVILEEQINRLSAKPDAGAMREIETLLESVAETLRRDEGRSGLLNWAASALPRLPAEVRKLGAAQTLAAASYFRLTANLPPGEKSKGGDLPDWLSWSIPKDLPPFDLGVQLVEGGVLVGGPAPPDHTIPVPGTNPLLVELSWTDGEHRHVQQLRLAKGERRKVEAPPVEIQLRTARGARYAIAPQTASEAEPEPEEKAARKTCYVAMGFGERVDFATGRKLNLDETYEHIIKPAVEEAGLECVRADEVSHPWVLPYEQLLKADVVVADLSTSNRDAIYQLGVRHGLRPYTTIVIAEDQFKIPFDIAHVLVRTYKHLGEHIGVSEVMRFRAELTSAITATVSKSPPGIDSPVYTFLKGLVPPALPGETPPATADAPRPETESAQLRESVAELIRRADEALMEGKFYDAKSLLTTVRTLMRREAAGRPEGPYIIQRLALATYRSEHPAVVESLWEARDILKTLDPATSSDTETLWLWGEVHRRLWEETGDGSHLEEAVGAHRRGFYLRQDTRNGVALAFLLNLRAARAARRPADAVADFVQARRVRREVISSIESSPRTAEPSR
ncbi:MAG TPA: tetratricopeptide repeat-containing protein, partial [Pyrinomonadaceae bacterium]